MSIVVVRFCVCTKDEPLDSNESKGLPRTHIKQLPGSVEDTWEDRGHRYGTNGITEALKMDGNDENSTFLYIL